jgi:hypothetical protein
VSLLFFSLIAEQIRNASGFFRDYGVASGFFRDYGVAHGFFRDYGVAHGWAGNSVVLCDLQRDTYSSIRSRNVDGAPRQAVKARVATSVVAVPTMYGYNILPRSRLTRMLIGIMEEKRRTGRRTSTRARLTAIMDSGLGSVNEFEFELEFELPCLGRTIIGVDDTVRFSACVDHQAENGYPRGLDWTTVCSPEIEVT